jgi:hypothetical protein
VNTIDTALSRGEGIGECKPTIIVAKEIEGSICKAPVRKELLHIADQGAHAVLIGVTNGVCDAKSAGACIERS